jgi:hypothetical protein
VSDVRNLSVTLSLAGGLAVAVLVHRGNGGRWLRVARDSDYDIAIDTTRIAGSEFRGFRIWFRTQHAARHYHDGLPFDREIVESVIDCRKLTFRIASVDLSLDDRPPISRQRTEAGELTLQPWRQVEPRTIEEAAAIKACDFARHVQR